jgi:hypothetical protein
VERSRTPWRILLAAAAAAALALGGSGCALTLSGPASNRPRDQRPSCDTSKTFVATDTLLGSLFGLGTLAAIAGDAGEAALLPGAISAAFLLSALSGNAKVNDCQLAIAAFDGPDPIAGAPPFVRPPPDEPPPPVRPPSAVRTPPAVRPTPIFHERTPLAPGPASAAPAPAPAAPSAPSAPAPSAPAPSAPAPAAPATPAWPEFWKELP